MDKFWGFMREEGIVRNIKWTFWVVLAAVLAIVVKWNHWSWDYWVSYYMQSNPLTIIFDFLSVAVWPIGVPIIWAFYEFYCICVSPGSSTTEGE